VTVLIVGFFVFPVWWAGCCNVCTVGVNPCARNVNIASIILGSMVVVWLPCIFVFVILPAMPEFLWPRDDY
jgi:hypothetical protein